MQSTITLNTDVFQQAIQLLQRTHFSTLEELMAFLIEEKLQETSPQKNDPIVLLRGKLKGKIGGTKLFMNDKQAEIEQENRI